jgi:hypothetical protein
MRRKGARRHAKVFRQIAGRHGIREFADQAAEDVEPRLLRERTESFEGQCLFHISRNTELLATVKARMNKDLQRNKRPTILFGAVIEMYCCAPAVRGFCFPALRCRIPVQTDRKRPMLKSNARSECFLLST